MTYVFWQDVQTLELLLIRAALTNNSTRFRRYILFCMLRNSLVLEAISSMDRVFCFEPRGVCWFVWQPSTVFEEKASAELDCFGPSRKLTRFFGEFFFLGLLITELSFLTHFSISSETCSWLCSWL